MRTSNIFTAYHEAAHAVATYYSGFFNLIGRIRVTSHDSGYSPAGLSKTKCLAYGKRGTADDLKDPDVEKDYAVILLAGFAAERHYFNKHSNAGYSAPDKSYSQQDYFHAESRIGYNGVLDYEPKVADLIIAMWAPIEALAELLNKKGIVDADDAAELIEHYNLR